MLFILVSLDPLSYSLHGSFSLVSSMDPLIPIRPVIPSMDPLLSFPPLIRSIPFPHMIRPFPFPSLDPSPDTSIDLIGC